MDIGTISLVLMLGLMVLLAIGMPLGMASAILAALAVFAVQNFVRGPSRTILVNGADQEGSFGRP